MFWHRIEARKDNLDDAKGRLTEENNGVKAICVISLVVGSKQIPLRGEALRTIGSDLCPTLRNHGTRTFAKTEN